MPACFCLRLCQCHPHHLLPAHTCTRAHTRTHTLMCLSCLLGGFFCCFLFFFFSFFFPFPFPFRRMERQQVEEAKAKQEAERQARKAWEVQSMPPTPAPPTLPCSSICLFSAHVSPSLLCPLPSSRRPVVRNGSIRGTSLLGQPKKRRRRRKRAKGSREGCGHQSSRRRKGTDELWMRVL